MRQEELQAFWVKLTIALTGGRPVQHQSSTVMGTPGYLHAGLFLAVLQ